MLLGNKSFGITIRVLGLGFRVYGAAAGADLGMRGERRVPWPGVLPGLAGGGGGVPGQVLRGTSGQNPGDRCHGSCLTL